MAFSSPHAPINDSTVSPAEDNPTSQVEEKEGHGMLTQPAFVGGPRPTVTKLKVNNYLSSFVSSAPHLSGVQIYFL